MCRRGTNTGVGSDQSVEVDDSLGANYTANTSSDGRSALRFGASVDTPTHDHDKRKRVAHVTASSEPERPRLEPSSYEVPPFCIIDLLVSCCAEVRVYAVTKSGFLLHALCEHSWFL